MARLVPERLHVRYLQGVDPKVPNTPRYCTLTHSDSTGELFLTVGPNYEVNQVSGLYTRLMRDEVLVELRTPPDGLRLDVYCHVSGGLVFGRAGWRYSIFRSELPLVLEAIRYGDRGIVESDPNLDQVPIIVRALQVIRFKIQQVREMGHIGRLSDLIIT